MPINPLSFPQPQAYSGGVDFSPLANLGNVYREAQDRQQMLSALGQLGNDPVANSQMLVKSGNPQLAQLGLKMQETMAQRAEDRRQFEAGLALKQQIAQENIREFESEQKGKQAELALKQAAAEADTPKGRYLAIKGAVDEGYLPPETLSDPETIRHIQTGEKMGDDKMSAIAQKTLVDNDRAASSAEGVVENLQRLKELSKTATSGIVGAAENKYLGGLGSWTPQAVKDAQQMQQLATMNVLAQVKALFPGRVLASEFNTLQKLENPTMYSDEVRQQAYDRLIELAQSRFKNMEKQNEAIRSGKFFKPQDEEAAPTSPSRATAAPETAAPKGPGVGRITSKEDYDKLPSGTKYIDPEGNQRTKR